MSGQLVGGVCGCGQDIYGWRGWDRGLRLWHWDDGLKGCDPLLRPTGIAGPANGTDLVPLDPIEHLRVVPA